MLLHKWLDIVQPQEMNTLSASDYFSYEKISIAIYMKNLESEPKKIFAKDIDIDWSIFSRFYNYGLERNFRQCTKDCTTIFR